MMKRYEHAQEFYDSVPDGSMYAVRDAEYAYWLVFCGVDCDWWAVRPATEDDVAKRPMGPDRSCPVGPIDLDALPGPLLVLDLDRAFSGAGL